MDPFAGPPCPARRRGRARGRPPHRRGPRPRIDTNGAGRGRLDHVFAGRDITAALEDTYRADVHSGIGRRIDEMLPTLQSAVRQRPFALVVNLGTNDALQAETHPDWRTGFARMIAIVTPARCVVLTTISTLVHDSNVAPAVASEINDAILAAVAAHPNLHVVDWNAAVHAAKGASLLVADRIHPSTAGDLTLASLDRTALDRDCRHN